MVGDVVGHGLAAARLFVPSGTLAVRQTRTPGSELEKETIAAQPSDGAVTSPVVLLSAQVDAERFKPAVTHDGWVNAEGV